MFSLFFPSFFGCYRHFFFFFLYIRRNFNTFRRLTLKHVPYGTNLSCRPGRCDDGPIARSISPLCNNTPFEFTQGDDCCCFEQTVTRPPLPLLSLPAPPFLPRFFFFFFFFCLSPSQISVHAIDRTHDDFVVLASDGLWDHVNNDEAVEIVRIAAYEDGDPESAGDRLIKVHIGTNDLAKKWTRTKERGTVVVECTQVQLLLLRRQLKTRYKRFFCSLDFCSTVLRFDIDVLLGSIRDS